MSRPALIRPALRALCLCLTLLAASAWTEPSSAQAPSPELPPANPDLPEARTLLGQAAAGLGTPERLAAIQSYRIEAALEVVTPAQGPRPEIRAHYHGSLAWRADGHALWRATADSVSPRTATVYQRRFESGIRPEVMWSRFPETDPNGEPDPRAGRNVRLPRVQAAGDIVAVVDPYRFLYHGIARHADSVLEPRTTRREQRQGRDCFRIDARLRYPSTTGVLRLTVWLDVSQSRVIEVHAGSTVLYDDWRDVEGVLAPYRFTAMAFCGERSLRHDRMATATNVVFNDVTVEEIVPPTDLVDLADLVSQP